MGFEKKPQQNEMGKIQYVRKNLSIDEIAEYIKNGHVLSANFTEDDSTVIRQTQRCYENFISTSMIMIDLDGEVEFELNELIEKLNQEGITIIMISHDIAAALKYATHILHVDKKIFFGSKEKYLQSEMGKRFVMMEGGTI